MAVFRRLLEQLKDLPQLECVHFGGFGEPLSHPHIFEMIKNIKDMGLRVEMISNGSLLTEEKAGMLIDLGLDRLFISLDGPDEEAYNEIRIGADFTGVIANIKRFNAIKRERRAAGPELAIEFVAMKKNYHKLPQVARLIDKLEARYLLVTNVLPYCEELKDEVVYDLDDTVPLFGINDSTMLMMRAQLPHMKFRTQRYCKFIEDGALTVTREGNISSCYALMHPYKCFVYGREKQIYPYHLGNINEKTVKEIWTDPAYVYFRTQVKDFSFPSCTDCRSLEGCTMADDNVVDCWGNSPSCAECLWARGMIVCP
jgi:tungsten cofactor oxidoreducase radical SAM maturase